MEILFLIALALREPQRPKQLKKDWNEKQENGLLIIPEPFASEINSAQVQKKEKIALLRQAQQKLTRNKRLLPSLQ